MPKRSALRARILTLYRILSEESDAEHPIPLADLLARLAAEGIPAERKSLYEDFEALRCVGFDVRYQNPSGWCLVSGALESAELRLLVDTVQAAHTISLEQSRTLIEKLTKLASCHQKEQLRRELWVEGRVKSTNDSVYANIDCIQESLRQQCTLSFQYFTYDEHKQKVLRREGARYVTSPRALIWNHENYYLVALDHRSDSLRHYRVDKMQRLQCLTLPAKGTEEPFDPAEYSRRHFSMFGGREAHVTIRAHKRLVGVLLDRFAMEAALRPDGIEHVLLEGNLSLSPQFFAWLFGLGEEAQLLSPYWAVQEYQGQLRLALERHSGFS